MSVAANATTIDFTGLTPGTMVTTQYPGVTFPLVGGFDSNSPAVGNVFDGPVALGNSGTNSYPTAYALNIAFDHAVGHGSFTYDNFGSDNGSNCVASNGATMISTGLTDSFNSCSASARSSSVQLYRNHKAGR